MEKIYQRISWDKFFNCQLSELSRYLSWMLEEEEQTDDWELETLESLKVCPVVGLVTLLVEMLLPLPLSVLVVECLQPELAPEPTVTLLDTESWPGDWRSGEREARLSPRSSMLEAPGTRVWPRCISVWLE